MDIFIKKRFAAWAIGILATLNLIALGMIFLLMTRTSQPSLPPGERGPNSIHFFLKRELDLSKDQMQEFKRLGDEHHRESDVLHEDIHRLKREMMEEMFASHPNSKKVDALAEEIGTREAQLQKQLFSHFMNLASVCNPEQRAKFEVLLHDVLDLTRPRASEGPPGPRRDRSPPPRKKPPKRRKPPFFPR